MSDPFNPFEFAAFLRARWRLFAVTCGVAATLAGLLSVILPKRYTATASILISPPAGNDPRAATALSPIYLESLKTYERIASNDTLFVRALERFHLRAAYAGTPVERLKGRILKVIKPVNTEILEINATLGDPRAAQGFAQFIAEQTREASLAFDQAAEQELTAEARHNLDRAQTRFAAVERARRAFAEAGAVRTLEEKLLNSNELRSRIEEDLTIARTELANRIAEQNATAESNEQGWAKKQAATAEAKLKSFEQQERTVTAQAEAQATVLEKRESDEEALESELIAARAEIESAKSKLNDIAASSAFHGERLQIIDPGIVPQQPSSPNLWLNVAAALLISIVTMLLIVTVQFSGRHLHSGRPESEYSFH